MLDFQELTPGRSNIGFLLTLMAYRWDIPKQPRMLQMHTEDIGRAVDRESATRLREKSSPETVANLIVAEAGTRRLAEDLSVIDADVVDETAELPPLKQKAGLGRPGLQPSSPPGSERAD